MVVVTPAPTSIPEGTYSRVLHRDALVAGGSDPAVVDEMLGADGELPEALKVQGDRWTFFVTSDGGETEIGTLGTASYNAGGQWVLVEGGGTAGFTSVYDWGLSDGTLTLTAAPVQVMAQFPDSVLFTGAWKQGP
jgi:hypothetical protein